MPYAFMHEEFLATCNKLTSIPDGVEFVEFESGSLPADPEMLSIINGEIVKDQEKAVTVTIKRVDIALREMLNTEAQRRGYDSIDAIGKYIGHTNKYRKESEELGVWAAECWDKRYTLQTLWESRDLDAPTVESVLAVMPEAP